MLDRVPEPWRDAVAALGDKSAALELYVRAEREAGPVYPPAGEEFNALAVNPPAKVRAVILGQDPYHDEGQAHGLAFSVRPGVPLPPSLRNILREYANDLGLPTPKSGCLQAWADRGVLLLNTVLTVRAHAPLSHKGRGWETFTDAAIRLVSEQSPAAAFVLWGKPAAAKLPLIDAGKHGVFTSVHPSPLSARRGFFGSKPFSRVNDWRTAAGREPIDWRLD